jgi:inner membrane transporter RhtA
LLPALATIIGIGVLAQIPTMSEAAGVVLVVGGVALHRAAAPAHSEGPAAARGEPA